MKKKLLMAAVGAALAAAPMLATQANTAVYGHFHMSLDNVDNGNAAYGYVASNSSRIGVKGDEDLGSGLKAIYQMESGAFAADTGSAGLGNTLRNTFVGFAGSWGAVKVGRHDTPFKDLGRKLDNFNEEVGDMRNILSGSSSGASIYDYRASNMIRYESPSMSGFTVNALHTSNTTTGGPTTDAEGPGTTGGKALNSIGANFTTGPLFLGFAWQKASYVKGTATTAFGQSLTATSDNDNAYRLAGSYTINDFMFGLIYQDLKDILGADLSQKAWGLAASYKMANNLLKFQYLQSDDFSGNALTTTSDTGGKLWALGADHMFSKTTLVYVNYAEAKNGDNTNIYSVMSGNAGHGENLLPSSGLPTTVDTTGKKVKGLTAGMILNF